MIEEAVLLIEDKHELRLMLKTALGKENFQVADAPDCPAALLQLRRRDFSAVLTDLKLPGAGGLDVLRAVKEHAPHTPVIIMTAYGSVEEAVKAMKEGAYDFIQKPLDLAHLTLLLRRAIAQQQLLRENILLKQEFAERHGFPRIIGEHPSLQKAASALQRIAPTDTTVLLLGESGTGKELFARAIHSLSPRAQQPFVAINCAAIPETLVETELFGHEKGAFTGATGRKLGKFELAHRGTIFLDEIGEIPLAIQAKILRVLEERSFERVGGVQTTQVDVRIITATNRDLQAAVAEKQFREDLYFRLSAFPITVPPLRERGQDVIALAEVFARQFCQEFKRPSLRLSRGARELLMEYHWPGNVRELQNALERAVILAEGDEIQPGDLQVRLPRAAAMPAPSSLGLPAEFNWDGTLTEVTERAARAVEGALLLRTMEACRWNKAKAAERLGVAYKTLLTKIHAHGLNRAADPSAAAETAGDGLR
ncbi:MAG: sigma-54-dependent transcriptional regulator [Terriglobales bacterium]